MRQPLDGARLKIVRAQEHLDTFKRDAKAFLDTKPYKFESEVYVDHWWVKPRPTSDPPKMLSFIVGDVVTNIRASLDYAIWELANRYFNAPPDLSRQADRSVLTFPILLADPNRRQGHIDHLHRLQKRGFPTGTLDIITDAQADVRGDESLRWLYDLVNMDKHRTPILTVSMVERTQIAFQPWLGKTWLIRPEDFINDGVAVKAPHELLDGIRSGAVKVDLQATVAITTHDVAMPRMPIDKTLTQIIKCVSDVIPRFDPFLA